MTGGNKLPDTLTVSSTKSFEVKDVGLAAAGRKRIEWAGSDMPVLGLIGERFKKEKPLLILRIIPTGA